MKKIEIIRKDFLTAKEASERLHIPLSTIYRLSNRGMLKSMHVGARWYFPIDEIERYLSCELTSFHTPIRQKEFPERRKFPRINCNMECNYLIPLPGKNEMCNAVIKNISAGGLLMCDKDNNRNLELEDPIKIEFKLNLDEGNESFLNVKGRVVRKMLNTCGIKFRNIDEKSQHVIVQFVG